MAFLMPNIIISQAGAAITPGHKENGGGNTPKGEANGVPSTPATNPAGSAPPGQNK
jgi:hypothetical protein